MGLDEKRGYSSEAQQGFKRRLYILEASPQQTRGHRYQRSRLEMQSILIQVFGSTEAVRRVHMVDVCRSDLNETMPVT